VVEKDYAMEGLVEQGEEQFTPLLELRDYLKSARDCENLRMDKRRNGQDGLGPFKPRVRRDLLNRLLTAQKESGLRLIDGDELTAIAEVWAQDGQPVDIAFRIWKHVYEGAAMPDEPEADRGDLSEEDVILEGVCREEGVPFDMMRRLRDLEEEFAVLKRRHGLPHEMRETVCQYTNPEANK
jgi:DNA sulfur modification protein DndC